MSASLEKAQDHFNTTKIAYDKIKKKYDEAEAAVKAEQDKIEKFKKEETESLSKIETEMKKQKKKMSKSLIETTRILEAMSAKGAGKMGSLNEVTTMAAKKKDKESEKKKQEEFMKKVEAQLKSQKEKVEKEKKGKKEVDFDEEMRLFDAGKKYLKDNFSVKDTKNRENVKTKLIGLGIEEEKWEKLMAIKDERLFVTRLANVAKQRNFLATLKTQADARGTSKIPGKKEETADEMKERQEKREKKIKEMAQMLRWKVEDTKNAEKIDGFVSAIQQGRVYIFKKEEAPRRDATVASTSRSGQDEGGLGGEGGDGLEGADVRASLDVRSTERKEVGEGEEGLRSSSGAGREDFKAQTLPAQRPKTAPVRRKGPAYVFVVFDEGVDDLDGLGTLCTLSESEAAKIIQMKPERKVMGLVAALEAKVFDRRLRDTQLESANKKQRIADTLENERPKPKVTVLHKGALDRLTSTAPRPAKGQAAGESNAQTTH
mmetsp:Transcript_29860/g.77074  ORF Transcript_29860/g.77074 Transcript_29860/m.77074 type:complete len:488 (-) Transcript_29860:378-1841(-)